MRELLMQGSSVVCQFWGVPLYDASQLPRTGICVKKLK